MAHIHELIDFVVSPLIVRDGRVLLVDHKELGRWLPPGGHIELDEDTDRALLREIQEETGLTADDIEVLAERPEFGGENQVSLWRPQWLNIHRISDNHRHIALYYLIRAKTDRIKLLPSEHNDIRWVSLEELNDLSFNVPRDVRFYAKEAIGLV